MVECTNCARIREQLEHRGKMIDKQSAQIELLKEMLESAHRKLERYDE